MRIKLLLLLPVFLLATVAAKACLCVKTADWDSELNQVKDFHSADAVFIGKVMTVKGVDAYGNKVEGDRFPEYIDITFRVDKYYKQPAESGSEFTFRSLINSSEHSYRTGQKWLMVARLHYPGFYSANICSPSGKFTEQQLTKKEPARFYKFLTEELPKLDGKIKLKHENGKVALKGKYKNALPHGEFKIYYEDGNLRTVSYYENGFLTGFTKFDSKTGAQEFKTTILPDRRFYKVQYFDENQKLKGEEEYLDQKRITRAYYKNEILKQEEIVLFPMDKEKRKKFLAAYYPNGKLKEKGWERNEQKTGEWTYGTEFGETKTVIYP